MPLVADPLVQLHAGVQFGQALVPAPHPTVRDAKIEAHRGDTWQILEALVNPPAALEELDRLARVAGVQRHVAELLQSLGDQSVLTQPRADLDGLRKRGLRRGVVGRSPAQLADLQSNLGRLGVVLARQHLEGFSKYRRGLLVRPLDAQCGADLAQEPRGGRRRPGRGAIVGGAQAGDGFVIAPDERLDVAHPLQQRDRLVGPVANVRVRSSAAAYSARASWLANRALARSPARTSQYSAFGSLSLCP